MPRCMWSRWRDSTLRSASEHGFVSDEKAESEFGVPNNIRRCARRAEVNCVYDMSHSLILNCSHARR
jgi:hypothetical protein